MLDTDEWDTIDVPDSPEARKADFCLTIHGNSMEPVYYNGDIVLVKEQQSVEKGTDRHIHYRRLWIHKEIWRRQAHFTQ